MSLRHLYKDLQGLGVYPDLLNVKRCKDDPYGDIHIYEHECYKYISDMMFTIRIHKIRNMAYIRIKYDNDNHSIYFYQDTIGINPEYGRGVHLSNMKLDVREAMIKLFHNHYKIKDNYSIRDILTS